MGGRGVNGTGAVQLAGLGLPRASVPLIEHHTGGFLNGIAMKRNCPVRINVSIDLVEGLQHAIEEGAVSKLNPCMRDSRAAIRTVKPVNELNG